MAYVIPAPAQVTVPVEGGSEFPVRHVFCVGRNYAAHAREMGANPEREAPFFFAKPAHAVLAHDTTMPYPSKTASLHHEIELVAALAKGGRDIPAAQALDHVFGYAVGLDMTRRDLQAEAKAAGRPWDMAKGFDHSAPIGPILPADRFGRADHGAIWLKINGEERQRGDLADMIWSVAETIAALSTLVELAPGDLIFTGTPEGVGAVGKGDRLVGHIDGLPDLSIVIGH